MHHAGTIPKQHISACSPVDPGTQIFIRSKNDLLVLAESFPQLPLHWKLVQMISLKALMPALQLM